MRGTWQTTSGGPGGGLVLVLIIAALAVGSGAASAAVSALVTIAVITGAVIALAVLGGIALLVYRARQTRSDSERVSLARSDRPGRPIEAAAVPQIGAATGPELSNPYKMAAPEIRNGIADLTPEIRQRLTDLRAIEPPREIHYHFHVSPDQLAEIMRHHTEEE